jgi:hypothetical protein
MGGDDSIVVRNDGSFNASGNGIAGHDSDCDFSVGHVALVCISMGDDWERNPIFSDFFWIYMGKTYG